MGTPDEEPELPEEWLEHLFSDENCDECGLGAEGHDVILLMGNYFARCKNPVEEDVDGTTAAFGSDGGFSVGGDPTQKCLVCGGTLFIDDTTDHVYCGNNPDHRRPHRAAWSPGVPVVWDRIDDTQHAGEVVQDYGGYNVLIRFEDGTTKQVDYRQVRCRP